MKITVWNTYVEKEDGNIMHFDFLVHDNVTNEQTIFDFGKAYLKTKPFQIIQLTSNECRLCHVEKATEEMISAIEKNGYYIIEMENCN